MKVIILVLVLFVTPINVFSEPGWLFWVEERSFGPAYVHEPFKWTFVNAYVSWKECDDARTKRWEKESAYHGARKITEPTPGFSLGGPKDTLERYFYCLPVGFDPRGTTGTRGMTGK